jgi:hypothetical protein
MVLQQFCSLVCQYYTPDAGQLTGTIVPSSIDIYDGKTKKFSMAVGDN